MKINIYNKNPFVIKLFQEVYKNNIVLNCKDIQKSILNLEELQAILYTKKNELNFINLDNINIKLLLELEKTNLKIMLNKIIFISTKKLKLNKEIKYFIIEKNKEQDTQYFITKQTELEKIINEIVGEIHIKNKNLDKSKNYIDKNLDLLIPFIEKPQYLQKQIIAIGSSIGGVKVIEELINLLNIEGKLYPPIVITQHIMSSFANNVVNRLNNLSNNLEVLIVNKREKLNPNTIYISNGENHMIVLSANNQQYVDIIQNDVTINEHRPSINALFRTVAQCYGSHAIGIVLTGMGKDGIVGIGEIKSKGGYTIAQSKASSIVHGIAGTAIKENFINEELSIQEIALFINK